MARRGENIYKRKDGRWEGRYIKEYDLNNKAKYASVYAHTYTEVKQKLLQIKSQTKKIHSQQNKNTIGGYAILWLNEIKRQVKHSTFVKYTNIVNNHIIPDVGSKNIDETNTEMVRKFIENKILKGNLKTGDGLSAKSVKDIISILKLIFKYAEIDGIKHQCDFDIITIKSTKMASDNINSATQSQFTRYLLHETDYTKFGILLCLYTGLRIGEVCAMKFEDISIEERIIHVDKTMQRIQNLSDSSRKTDIIITPPKSKSSQRDIPIPDFIVNIVSQFQCHPQAYLLTGERSKFIEPRTLENRFKAHLKKCGLNNYNFHQLRHRFATNCIELGFEIKSLSEILGHSNVNITLNRYVHSSIELKRTNMNKLEECFVY